MKILPINNYEESYHVSDSGNVFSIKRHIELKASVNPKGYSHVQLHNKGKSKTFQVHRLVASAFIPNPTGLPVVNHLDGDPTNNRVDNLEWCSHKQNTNHSWNNGFMESTRDKYRKRMMGKKGDLCYATKLSDAQIAEIREFARKHKVGYNQWNNGYSCKRLANDYGVSMGHMIIRGERR